MANQMQLPAGPTNCYAVSPTMRLFVDRATGEATKIIVPLKIDVGGEHIEHAEFMTVDPDAETSKGKRRIEFTLDALKKLGATHAAEDLADALDKGATEVTFRWGEPGWAPCDVKHSGAYINVNIGDSSPVELNPAKAKKAGDAIRKLAGGSKQEAANPFAPRPGTGAPVAPPPARPKLGAPSATGAPDTSFDFGANAPAPPATT